MRVPLNDLARRSPGEIDVLVAKLRDIVVRGVFLQGEETRSLETHLELLLGRPAVAVGNGTDALIAALTYASHRGVRTVALAPNAGGYGSIAARRIGLRVVYTDIDPITAQMDPEALRKSIELFPEIGAVIMTHLYGLCGDVVRVREICDTNDLLMIEDCAQALGATKEGKPAGSFGDLATFSFYPTKNVGGMGDAGAVACSTKQIREQIARLCQYGWEGRYDIAIKGGFNSRIDEFQAAMVNHELLKISELSRQRRAIVDRYRSALQPPRRMISLSGEDYVAHLAVMTSPDRERDRVALDAAGIETGVHYPFLDHQQRAWADDRRHPTPVADALNSSILTLPCFPTMTESEIDRVCEALEALT